MGSIIYLRLFVVNIYTEVFYYERTNNIWGTPEKEQSFGKHHYILSVDSELLSRTLRNDKQRKPFGIQGVSYGVLQT